MTLSKSEGGSMSKWTFETEAHTKEKTWGIWDDEGGGEVVCQHVQTLEHARLIAAAPELLDVASRLAEWGRGGMTISELGGVIHDAARIERAMKEEA
jgi:hypothetical protein